MSWLESLELTSSLPKHLESPFPIGVGSEEKGTDSISQLKREQNISTQSFQIKDLRAKLDGAVAENVQIRELLSPAALQMAFTNALQASQSGAKAKSSNNTQT